LKCYFLLVCLLCARPCIAAEPIAGLLACRALSDSAARLACFDRETAGWAIAPAAVVSAAPAAAPESSSAFATANVSAPGNAAPVLDARQTFGLNDSAIAAQEAAAGARPQKLTKIEARIVGLSLTGEGRTLFTLDDAQVWRQIESEADPLAKLGDSVTISRGMLGSYWLQLKSRRGCKVTRVR
jgi:hypothetical protein